MQRFRYRERNATPAALQVNVNVIAKRTIFT